MSRAVLQVFEEYPHVQNWLHQNENLFGHKTNLFGHKTLFDRDGLEKNLRAFGPQIFFSRNFWGCICVAVCWPKSAPPCAGRKFGENLRRRFALSFLMH